MANLLAVGVAALLAIVMVIAYALVLRELQKINANLEQFIKLVLDLRRRDDPQEANEILHKGSSSYRGFPPR
jgi:biopolymer transport protein ExbB/TolQ